MADLSGMFEQLNQAILGNPLMGDAGGKLLTMGSQGAGQALGAGMSGLTGKPVDPMTFMTPEAASQEGKQQLANVDMTTTQGLVEAAKIYQQMGEPAKAMEIAQMVRAKRAEDMKKLEANQDEMNAKLTDTKLRRSAAADARANGDKMAAQGLLGMGITPAEYYKGTWQNKLDTEKAIASQKRTPGKLTEVDVDGKKVKVLVYDDGSQRVVGKAPQDWEAVTQTDPATGIKYNVFIKPGTDQMQIGGIAEMPKVEVKGSAADGWVVLDHNGQKIRNFDHQSEAEKWQANYKQVAQTGMTKGVIKQALTSLGAVDAEGNMIPVDKFDPESGGWESLIFQYLPNTDERTLKGYIDVIKSNQSFDALTALEEPLTPVSNVEIMLLGQRIASLNPLDDPRVTAEKLHYVNKHLTNLQKLALGEPAQNSIDWTDPAYDGIVQRTRDAETGKLTIKLPDGTWLEVQ